MSRGPAPATAPMPTASTAPSASGEYVGGGAAQAGEFGMYADYLIGKNALERERIYNDVKRALRKNDS